MDTERGFFSLSLFLLFFSHSKATLPQQLLPIHEIKELESSTIANVLAHDHSILLMHEDICLINTIVDLMCPGMGKFDLTKTQALHAHN